MQKDSTQKNDSFSNRTSLISSCSTNGVSVSVMSRSSRWGSSSCHTHNTTHRVKQITGMSHRWTFRFKWNSRYDSKLILFSTININMRCRWKNARSNLFNLPLSSNTMKWRVWRRNMFVLALWETSILLDITEGQWKRKGIPLRAERWSQNCAIKFQCSSRRISRRIHHNVLQFTQGVGLLYFRSKRLVSPNIP